MEDQSWAMGMHEINVQDLDDLLSMNDPHSDLCFMIQVVCKQNGPNLEYRHARLKDGYYALCSVSWEQRPDNRVQPERTWELMMDEDRGRGGSLAVSGQVINCEITQERTSELCPNWFIAQSDKKQILDQAANAGKTQQAAFCRASVFSKIKAGKNVFSKSLNTINGDDVRDKSLFWTKVVIC